MARINGNWFKACREVIEAAGGHMNQYLGDGFLCYWDHDAESRTRLPALLGRLDEMRGGADPPFRVVLHLGKVVLGSVPTLSALNLHGPEVNFVFRMEKLAARLGEGILLSAAAAAGLGMERGRRHEAELAGYDGKYRFLAPDFKS